MSNNEKQVYLNEKQISFLNATQQRRTFVGGRGSGKSTVCGFATCLKMEEMPKGKSFLASITYGQILNQEIPAMQEAFRLFGLEEYNPKTKIGDYTICVKPPEDFKKAYTEPRKYQNVISFRNGYRIVLLSLDLPEVLRGGSYDAGDVCESALLKEADINKILKPQIRGNLYKPFSDSVFHHSLFDFTSAPWTAEGKHVYGTEELQKIHPEKYLFVESTAYDNVKVLGEEWFETQKESLTELEYAVEIMNKRLLTVQNAFYPAFSMQQHVAHNTYNYDENDNGIYIKSSSDYDPNEPLLISFDFNYYLCCCVVAQRRGDKLLIINEFYIKNDLISRLVDKITDHYQNHTNKLIYIYGDRSGYRRDHNATKMFDELTICFKSYGWSTILKALSKNIEHKTKHLVINNTLAGKTKLQVQINANNCKYTVISISTTRSKEDYRKDKQEEGKKGVEQLRATHLSDAFDYLVYPLASKLLGKSANLTQIVLE